MNKTLIIDDSKSFQQIVANELEPLAHQLRFADDGIQGLRGALLHHPKLITLDVDMPNLNGYSMAKILAMLGLQIPILFLTGSEVDQRKFLKLTPLAQFCRKEELKARLLPLAQGLLEAQKTRSYHDIEYSVSQMELVDLLAASKRKRILIVDDSATIRGILAKHLGQVGLYELYFAKDGQAGLIKAMMVKPDLILSDIDMPILNGVNMAQVLYVLGMPTPIYFITSVTEEKMVQQAKRLKAVRGYLVKEKVLKRPEQLLQRMEMLLRISPTEKAEIQKAYQNYQLETLMKMEW